MFKFKNTPMFRKGTVNNKPNIEHNTIFNAETDIYPYHNYAVWKLKQNVSDNTTVTKIKLIKSKLEDENLEMSLSDYYDLVNEKEELERNLDNAPNLLKAYTSEVKNVLLEFNELHSSIKSEKVGNQQLDSCSQEGQNARKIIAKFQKIFSKYIHDVTLTAEEIASDFCQQCSAKVILIEEEDFIECPNCGIMQLENLALSVSYLGLNSVKAYESVHNFARALEEFQGNVKLPPNVVIQKVKNYVEENKLQIEHLYALDIRGILKILGYNAWYKASHLILHKVTGKDLHNIEDIKENLLQDFQILDKLYKQNKISERQSSVNVWKIMEVLLRKHGYECHTKNFKKPITGDINIENNRILIQLFKLANWDTTLVI